MSYARLLWAKVTTVEVDDLAPRPYYERRCKTLDTWHARQSVVVELLERYQVIGYNVEHVIWLSKQPLGLNNLRYQTRSSLKRQNSLSVPSPESCEDDS